MFSFRIDKQLELRLLEDRDAEELFAKVDQNRRYLREWLPWLDRIKSVSDVRSFIQKSLEQFDSNNGFQAGIWFENDLVGVIGYHKIDWSNRTTSIGYWIDSSFQGKGLVTKACGALVDYAFSGLKLNRVEIACAAENKKSQAIPKRLGFTKEGVAHQAEWLYDHYVDHVVYGLLASDWKCPSDGVSTREAKQ